MDHDDRKTIRLVAKDEQVLYTPFSLIDLPSGRAIKWIIENLENHSDIVFKYPEEQ